MNNRGGFLVDRGLFDHAFFSPEPYTEREAWLWLIGNAAWKPISVNQKGSVINLERGQIAFSTRFMAVKWKWGSDARVRRYLDKLKKCNMIDAQTTPKTTLITICNYDDYQLGRRADDAQIVTKTTQYRRKEEEYKEVKKEELPLRGATAPELERELFKRGREILGKTAGGMIANLLKAKEGDLALARAALETASTKENAREYISKIIKGAGNGKRFNGSSSSERGSGTSFFAAMAGYGHHERSGPDARPEYAGATIELSAKTMAPNEDSETFG